MSETTSKLINNGGIVYDSNGRIACFMPEEPIVELESIIVHSSEMKYLLSELLESFKIGSFKPKSTTNKIESLLNKIKEYESSRTEVY